MVMNINLQIEELVLHGFAPAERYRIADAVEQELSALLGEHSPTDLATIRTGSISSLNLGSFRVTPNANSSSIGAQIANAIHGGLMK
jgi:hypothetical protein